MKYNDIIEDKRLNNERNPKYNQHDDMLLHSGVDKLSSNNLTSRV